MEIRKQIRNWIFKLFDNFSKYCNNENNSEIKGGTSKNKKKLKISSNNRSFITNKINIPYITLLNSSLETQLGKKRNRDNSNINDYLPDFLRNTKADLDIYNSYFEPTPEIHQSEFLKENNAKHIIIDKHIFDQEAKDYHKNHSTNSDRCDASKTEGEDGGEQVHANCGLEFSIPLESLEYEI